MLPLGEYQNYDLYFHPGKHWALIGRFGPNGDYQSGACKLTRVTPLVEARKRAVEKGLMAMNDSN